MTTESPSHDPLPDECDDLDEGDVATPSTPSLAPDPSAESSKSTLDAAADDEWEWKGFYGEVYPPDDAPTASPPNTSEPIPPVEESPPLEAYADAPPVDAGDIDFGVTYRLADNEHPGKRQSVQSGPAFTEPKGSIGNPLIKPLVSATKHLDVAKALITPPPPREFALPCLRAGTVGGLVSPGGTGKSMLAAQLALMVATGLETIRGISEHAAWQHITVGRVHYASFEDGEEEAGARLHSIWQSLGNQASADDLKTAAANLSVETLNGLRPPNLLDGGEWADWMVQACSGKRLVIIDTLRMAHLGDENDSADMAQLLAVMQGAAMQTGTAVLFLHHISKGAAQSGQGDSQQAARGSSVITDNARGQFFLAPMSEEEAFQDKTNPIHDFAAPIPFRDRALHEDDPYGGPMRRRYVRFGVAKSNYAAPWPDIWLRRGDNGVLTCAQLDQVGRRPSAPTGGKKGGRVATLA